MLILARWSHPTWVRGLKQLWLKRLRRKIESHPTWVRGLKLFTTKLRVKLIQVAPYVGAWIETMMEILRESSRRSHPTWVRGLKPLTLSPYDLTKKVAPYVGAWIETLIKGRTLSINICRTLRGCVD